MKTGEYNKATFELLLIILMVTVITGFSLLKAQNYITKIKLVAGDEPVIGTNHKKTKQNKTKQTKKNSNKLY